MSGWVRPVLSVVPRSECDAAGVPLWWDHGLHDAVLAAMHDRLRKDWSNLRFAEREAAGANFDEAKIPEGDQVAATDQILSFARAQNAAWEADEAEFRYRCEACLHPMGDAKCDVYCTHALLVGGHDGARVRTCGSTGWPHDLSYDNVVLLCAPCLAARIA